MDLEQKRKEIVDVFNNWIALYEHAPIEHIPAHKYAADAIKDCRDLVLAIIDGNEPRLS